jgi:hypothetical protein
MHIIQELLTHLDKDIMDIDLEYFANVQCLLTKSIDTLTAEEAAILAKALNDPNQIERFDVLTNNGVNEKYVSNLIKILPHLESLDLSHCKSLTSLPNPLPARLTHLHLPECANLTSLPNPLPAGLTHLYLADCANLTSLPNPLPAGLNELDLSLCANLTSLPNPLPAGLTKLYLNDCANLTSLPNPLPAGLNELDLSGCINLPNSFALIAQLEELERINVHNSNFTLKWPEHFDRSGGKVTKVMTDLKDAYKKYYSSHPNFYALEPSHDALNYPVLKLCHRFLNESVVVRGGLEAVIDSAIEVTNYIKENPQILEFLNESARGNLAACVNQPVAGFTEIACLVEIAKQTEIYSKLEAARSMMVVNLIRTEITQIQNSNGQKVGIAVEVELANAMLKEINNTLLQDKTINKSWPGVPNGIAHQAAIKSFLTYENIEAISRNVKIELQKPLGKVAEFFFEGPLQDFWSHMAISKEEREKISSYIDNLKTIFTTLDNIDSRTVWQDDEHRRLSDRIAEYKKVDIGGKILTKSKENTIAAISPNKIGMVIQEIINFANRTGRESASTLKCAEVSILEPKEGEEEQSFRIEILNKGIFKEGRLNNERPVLHCFSEFVKTHTPYEKSRKQARIKEEDNSELQPEEYSATKELKPANQEESSPVSSPSTKPEIQIPDQIILTKNQLEKLLTKLLEAKAQEVELNLEIIGSPVARRF